jgi:hypothetical protein
LYTKLLSLLMLLLLLLLLQSVSKFTVKFLSVVPFFIVTEEVPLNTCLLLQQQLQSASTSTVSSLT